MPNKIVNHSKLSLGVNNARKCEYTLLNTIPTSHDDGSILNNANQKTKSRICLFAGYNPNGEVAGYVLDYLNELRNHADIFYMADGELRQEELDKLKNYCVDAWVLNHGKYDFGSYSELAQNYIGWDRIGNYTEVIFANDSCFCLQEFGPIFSKMDEDPCDVWGLLATDENNKDYLYTLNEYLVMPTKKFPLFCLGSYFLVFRHSVINDPKFIKFINSVAKEDCRNTVCIKYEMGLTAFLKKNGFKISTFIKIVYRNVSVYDQQAFRLLKKGFPLLKIRIFKDNPLSIKHLEIWPDIIESYTNNRKIHSYLGQIEYKQTELDTPQTDILAPASDWMPPIFKMDLRSVAKLFIPSRLVNHCKRIIRIKNSIKIGGLYYKEQLKIDSPHLLSNSSNISEFVVIYFNVASDTIGGGMLSINRFVEHSKIISKEFGFDVLVSGVPLENLAVNYSMFEASSPMIHLSEITQKIAPKKAILNIPEYYLPHFVQSLNETYIRWLKSIPWLQINILNQNHEYFPDRYYIECCREITDDVTITTAHFRYTTQDLSSNYDCPVALLTPFLPEFYKTPLELKKKVILLSPDENLPKNGPSKQQIIDLLKNELPEFEVRIIQDLTLEKYKKLISHSRFAITFGEGYDGYFIEPFLSESISFAVFNETFFPDDFRDIPTVYGTWEELFKNIVDDIRILDSNSSKYREISAKTCELIKIHTNNDIAMQNLRDFYARKFTFLPEIYQDDLLFASGADQIKKLGGSVK